MNEHIAIATLHAMQAKRLDSHTNSTDSLVRPSAFKPVVPKSSFHSMQNLAQKGASSGNPGDHDDDSPGGGGGGGGVPGVMGGGMSDSGRNSLTSLPTYASSGGGCYGNPAAPVLGPLSASTSHINRLGGVGVAGGYQNGLSASDSGRSSSGKSSSSYQRLCHLGDGNLGDGLNHLADAPAPLRPSPSSDDIIQDLEDRLWEREQEASKVLHMRRNLDQSEAAMAQVFEEKQRVWEREMEELRQNYAARLQQVTRRAQRSQHTLQGQITHLMQDKSRLQEEIAALLQQRDQLERRCLDYRKEQAHILPQLEETQWEVCQKAGEISLLKQQLRDSQAEVGQRGGEMVALRGQLKELSAQLKERQDAIQGLTESYSSKSRELERCEGELHRTLAEVSLLRHKLSLFEAEMLGLRRALGEINASGGGGRSESLPPPMGSVVGVGSLLSPSSSSVSGVVCVPSSPAEALLSLQSDEAKQGVLAAGELRRQLERLQGELEEERQHRERQAITFKQERDTWQDEKERVLQYQAQLQLSYVEMLQKNQALEQRVDRLHTGTEPEPDAPMSLSLSLPPPPPLPPPDDPKLPPLHQLAPPWPLHTRLERIESTEI
ncbi:leucine zipper putative tumor suppressor 3 [Engraulis encrasicolus]|uniref:leucine zipper putative tumor suppressor 3 n=1 Tax=Engraulis encrasicolus TaxID=184585 RepID=UPI002FD20EBC